MKYGKDVAKVLITEDQAQKRIAELAEQINRDYEGKEYTLVMYLKNITGAGWADKPHMKRVQVSNVRKDDMDKYIDTTNNQTILILGYYNFDDNPVIVAWNAYRYVYHNTVRSCYVSVDNLMDAYKSGMAVTECSNQEIWVFKPNHFEEFLKNYIEQNKIGE